MADVLKRNKNRKNKIGEPSPEPKSDTPQDKGKETTPLSGDTNTPSSMPASAPIDTPTGVSSALPNDSTKRDIAIEPASPSLAQAMPDNAKSIPHDNKPEWAKLSYDELVKKNPNWSRAQYAYELAKWRKENGEPDMGYAEWSNILKGGDPYETEAERQSRERRNRNALIAQGVGSVLGNLINYARTRNGYVAMNLDDGTQGYNRLLRLREAQRQTARLNANSYLDAMGRDRAERAKQEATAAAAKAAERDYEMKVANLKLKIESAKDQQAQREAAAALKKLEFEHKKDLDEQKLKETSRYHSGLLANKGKGRGAEKYIDLTTGKGVKRYTPNQDGSNWIHKAYQDMLKEPGGDKYEVYKGGWGTSNAPTEQEMYDAITRYNSDQWKNQYLSNRYKGGDKKPPLE